MDRLSRSGIVAARFPSLDGARTFRLSSSRNIHITFVLASCRYAGLPRATGQLFEEYSHLGWSPVHCRVGRATMCAAAEDRHKREGWRDRKSLDSRGQKISTPLSPDPVSPYILLGMTATTGIDAVRLLALGRVFTANMTCNVVFFGFALAGAPGFPIPRSSMALVAFLLGAAAGGGLATHMSSRPAPHWTSRAFCVDGLLLISAALGSLVLRSPGDDNSIPLFGVIGLTALAMEFRNATTRKLGVPDLTTTVLTLTIAGLAADSFLAGGSNPRCAADVFGGCRG